MEINPNVACRLCVAPEIEPGHSWPTATVTQVNLDSKSLRIEYQGLHPFVYLDLLVRRADGQIVPSRVRYGLMFVTLTGPLGPRWVDLVPGESLEGGVGLLSHIEILGARPREWAIPAGHYTAEAVFEYRGWRVVSGTAGFEFRP